MNITKKLLSTLAIATLVSSSLILSGCGAKKEEEATKFNCTDHKIKITSTLSNWGSIAKLVAGDCAEVINIINSDGVEPHDFEPTAADTTTIEDSQILIINGADYDAWANNVIDFDSFNGTVINAEKVSTDNDVALLQNEGSTVNPHLWFNFDIFQYIGLEIYNAINTNLDSEYWAQTAESYSKFLVLDNDLATQISKFKRDLPNGTFAYAATESLLDYLMEDISYVDETPKSFKDAQEDEGEVGSAAIVEFEKIIKKKSISTLVVNHTELTDITENLITDAEKADIYILGATEMLPSDESDLISWISKIIEQIAENTNAVAGIDADSDED
jgi:zinc/manganese transport system substrate-binding protein